VDEAKVAKRISISNQNIIHPYLDETLGCSRTGIKSSPSLTLFILISSVSSLGLGFHAQFSGYGVGNCPSLLCAAALVGVILLRHRLVFSSSIYESVVASRVRQCCYSVVVIWKCWLGSAVFPYLVVSINCTLTRKEGNEDTFP